MSQGFIGEQLGSFRLEEVIGSGAMGVVFRATQEIVGPSDGAEGRKVVATRRAAVKIVQGEWDTIERDYHWHLEFLVYPERAMWVAGIAVTDMLPEEAARVLREAGSLEQPRADWRPSPG